MRMEVLTRTFGLRLGAATAYPTRTVHGDRRLAAGDHDPFVPGECPFSRPPFADTLC